MLEQQKGRTSFDANTFDPMLHQEEKEESQPIEQDFATLQNQRNAERVQSSRPERIDRYRQLKNPMRGAIGEEDVQSSSKNKLPWEMSRARDFETNSNDPLLIHATLQNQGNAKLPQSFKPRWTAGYSRLIIPMQGAVGEEDVQSSSKNKLPWKKSRSQKKQETKLLAGREANATKADNYQRQMDDRNREINSMFTAKQELAIPENLRKFITLPQEGDTQETKSQVKQQIQMLAGTQEQQIEFLNGKVQQFLEMDLVFTLRQDTDFVENLKMIEEVIRSSEAMSALFQQQPDLVEKLDQKNVKDAKKFLKGTRLLAAVFAVKLSIINDPYYRKHLNSKIPKEYHEGDSEEQRNLAAKIIKYDFLAEQYEEMRYRGSQVNRRLELEQPSEKSTKLIKQNSATEYLALCDRQSRGKDIPEHPLFKPYSEEEMGKLQKDLKDIKDGIKNMTYQGTFREVMIGVARDNAEPLEKKLAPMLMQQRLQGQDKEGLPKLEAFRHMEVEDAQKMLENMTAVPKDQEEQSIGDANLRNRAGLQQLKEVYGRQVNYVFQKYGKGLETIPLGSIGSHARELTNDLSEMPKMVESIRYMKEFPDVFNRNSKLDQRLEGLVNYYATAITAVNSALEGFTSGEIPNESAFHTAVLQGTADEQHSFGEVTAGMRGTIAWETEYQDDYRTEEEKAKQMEANEAISIRLWSNLKLQNQNTSPERKKLIEKVAEEEENAKILRRNKYYNIADPFAHFEEQYLMREGGISMFGWEGGNEMSDAEFTLMIQRLAAISPELHAELSKFRAAHFEVESYERYDEVTKQNANLKGTYESAKTIMQGYQQWKADHQAELDAAAQKQQTGLADYKRFMKSRYNYLMRKYGKGLSSLTLQEVMIHRDEIDTDLQGVGADDYLINKFPRFYDPTNAEDRALRDKVNYYTETLGVLKDTHGKKLVWTDKEQDFIPMELDPESEAYAAASRLDNHLRSTVDWGATYQRDFTLTPPEA